MATQEPSQRNFTDKSAMASAQRQADGGLAIYLAADHLAAELRAADTIIRAMLGVLTLRQKFKLAAQLERMGVSPDGMTRAHERHDELCRYDALQQRLNRGQDLGPYSSSPTRSA
jgi:hypothetical protein